MAVFEQGKGSAETGTRAGWPYWYTVVALFFLGWVFMYADRTILNPVMTTLQKQWGLSKSELGLMNSWFFLSYALLQIPAGLLGDRIGRKLVLVPGFLLFALASALTGLSKTFGLFMTARVGTGFGEGTYYGPSFALSSEAIPPKYRSIGSAIINSGQAFGISLGLIIASWLAFDLNLGWHMPFLVMSVPTVVVGLLIAFFVKEKQANKADAAQATAATPKVSIWSLLRNKNLIIVYVLVFCSLYGFFAVLTWLPYYLQTARSMAGSRVGIIASLVPWASIPGALFVGWLSDRLGRRKPLVFVLVPVACLALIATVYVQSYALLILALIVYGLTGKLALDPVLVAFVADNAPAGSYSTAYGLYNFIGMSSSILAPYITGWLADRTNSIGSGFYLSAALLLVGLVAFFFAEEKPVSRAA